MTEGGSLHFVKFRHLILASQVQRRIHCVSQWNLIHLCNKVKGNVMRAVLQRVLQASVAVDGKITGAIDRGILALISVECEDTERDATYIAEKTASLRIFKDKEDKMNLSLREAAGQVLVISQFTLHGDCRRGRRPSFVDAAKPEMAIPLYELVVSNLRAYPDLKVETGVFGAYMQVSLINDGPVTLLLDSKKRF